LQAFWNELRRRNVIKVGVSYAVIAWVLIQVVAVVVPTFGAPHWVTQTVTFLLIIGFPLAVGLAWAFEVTPDGVHRTRVPAAETTLTERSSGKLADDNSQPPAAQPLPPPSRPKNSLAVLPFANISPREEDAYFATGLHEEILNHLAKIRALNVVSRTSVLRYANSEQSIPDIAAELNVGAIMEGSVRYSGNRIRVTAQLIDATTDRHLWSETFDRQFDDVFAIESDVAINVAKAMQAAFSEQERAAVLKAATSSPEAYALYLQAWTLMADRSEDTRITALLDRAIALDPSFALAQAIKAWRGAEQLINAVNGVLVDDAEREEQQQRVKELARRALAIDPNVPYANAALADMLLYSWYWDEAAQAYERALEVAPHDVLASAYYGFLKSLRGRADEAVALQRKTTNLNPAASGAHLMMGFQYGYAKNFAAAIDELRRSTELAPAYPLNYTWIAYMELARGDLPAAGRALAMVDNLVGDGQLPLVYLPELLYAYSRLGERDRVARLRAEVEAFGADPVDVFGLGGMAMVHFALGERDKALDDLDRLAKRAERHQIDAGFINMMNLKLNFTEDPALKEPGIQQALARIRGDGLASPRV
jgi:adenylate cyclase